MVLRCREGERHNASAGRIRNGQAVVAANTITARAAVPLLGAGVSDPPDRAAGVIGDQERAVLRDGERRGPAPDFRALLAGSPETDSEVLVITLRPAVLERHPYDLVAGWHRAVPRP